MFRYAVETERRFYLANSVDVTVVSEGPAALAVRAVREPTAPPPVKRVVSADAVAPVASGAPAALREVRGPARVWVVVVVMAVSVV